jgi:stearoyl-CoA desaturase (delta-9 desaturase)
MDSLDDNPSSRRESETPGAMNPERSLQVAPVSPVRLGAGHPFPKKRRFGMPSWVKALPFLVLHLALVSAFFVPVTATGLILCGVAYFIRMFGITGGYHRYFAHKAYKTSRVFQFVLAWLGGSSLQKGPLWWAAHHREHHRHSDTPHDPHSPHETSFWWSHVGWILSNDHVDTPWEAIPDLAKYPELRWLDRNHWIPGVVLAVICYLIGYLSGGLSGGLSGLVWGFVVSTILLYHGTFTINSLSHLFGSRRYATSDDSRNNFWLALITLGEGWHNNHHHYQSSVNQGFFWWEIDISYYIIRTLSLFGLVWDLRKPGSRALGHRLVKPSPAPTPLEQVAATAAEPADAPSQATA